MNISKVKVENMDSPRTGSPVANQFIIRVGNQTYFQSYKSIIVKKYFCDSANCFNEHIVLDKTYWNYSVTTSKYRNEFLGENTKETRVKIESGDYTLTDLN